MTLSLTFAPELEPSPCDQPLLGPVNAKVGAAERPLNMPVGSVPALPISRSPSVSQSAALPLTEPAALNGLVRELYVNAPGAVLKLPFSKPLLAKLPVT